MIDERRIGAGTLEEKWRKYMIKIAIVEDEAMYAKQLEEFLRQYEKENGEAFDITIYSDGDQIVNKYRSQYDIILMDVEMKFMDGMSAAEEIRKVDTEVVIILSQTWRSMRSAATRWMRSTMF